MVCADYEVVTARAIKVGDQAEAVAKATELMIAK